MSANNITETLFEAISMIAENRIANLNYDKTLVCTVIDNSKAKKNNLYTVSDGNIKFEAQGDGANYAINDSVRVLILNGDFSKEKFIQGKYNENKDVKPITYVSPLNSIIEITDNLFTSDDENAFGIAANQDKKETLLQNFKFDQEDILNKDIYDTLFLKASFLTCFNNEYELRSGDYGLHLILGTKNENQISRYDLYFSATRDMFGNPYAFSIYTPQEIKYSLSQFPDGIQEAWLYLYQDNQFTYFDNNTQNIKRLEVVNIDDTIISNIKVKDIYFGFGNEINKVENNSVKIYTNDSMNFDHLADADNLSINEKTLNLLWYNKTEDNKYIGFSDGIVDLDTDTQTIKPYDESVYLNAIASNERLLNQIKQDYPKDEMSLELQADISEIVEAANYCSKLIGVDLKTALSGFESHVKAISGSQFDEILATGENATSSVGYFSNKISEDSQKLGEMYAKILQSAFKKETLNIYTEEDIKNAHNCLGEETGYIGVACQKTQTILDNIKNLVDTRYNSYNSIYTSYNIKITKILDTLKKKKEFIKNTYTKKGDSETLYNNISRLSYLAEKGLEENLMDYKDQKEELAKNYDNRYCIYWYKENIGYTETNKPFLPDNTNWQYIENSLNKGLPSKYIYNESNDTYYFDKKASSKDQKQQTLYSEGEELPKEKQKYKAVLFYNHNKFISNELEFTNNSKVPDSSAIDVNGALTIVHGNNSQSSYQSYGESGFLINAGDNQKKRELKVEFSGTNGEDLLSLDGGIIYWYVPENSTMIEIFDNDFNKFDDNNKPIWYTNKLKKFTSKDAFDKAVGLNTNKFYLVDNDIYEYDIENKIWKKSEIQSTALREASIEKPGYYCFYRQLNITEDNVNNNSTIIFPYHISNYYLSTATQNGIFCKIIKNNKTYYAETFLTFSSYGTSGTDFTLALNPEPEYPMYINNFSEENKSKDLHINITLYDAENQIIDIGKNGELCKLSIYPTNSNYSLTKEINADNLIGCFISRNNNNTNYSGILKCELDNVNIDNRLIKLTSYCPIPYSNIETQYIEGASTIIYDSNGGNPQYFKKPYKLYSSKDDTEISNIEWKMQYYDNNGTLINYDNLETDFEKSLFITLKSDNTLQIPLMYIKQDIYPVILAIKKDTRLVLWAQPILIIQNRYSSPMLNDWDGQLKVDKDNNAILSMMVGAGIKNENNTFSGVLMGEIGGLNAGEGEIGLYGYKEGEQSFGFKVDGTAFLGKTGHGRIYMDGNNGFIASGNWLSSGGIFNSNGGLGGVATQGMAIDLQEGHIDAYNFKLTSNGIKLNSSPKDTTENYVEIGEQDKGLLTYGNDTLKLTNADNNTLMEISDSNYYLQTADYTENTTGVRLDLKTGELLANTFKIKVDNTLLLDSAPVTGTDNYLFIGDNGTHSISYNKNGVFAIKGQHTDTILKTLLEVSKDNYYLQTTDYAENITGVRLDLKTGELLANTFKIKAGTTLLIDSDPTDNYLFIGNSTNHSISYSTDGVFSIKGLYTNSDGTVSAIRTLLEVSDNNYYLQSCNYTATSGMKINLQNGHIDAYNFKLTSNDIQLNSSPQNNENYMFIGDNDNYISFNNNKQLILQTSTFSLSTNGGDEKSQLYYSDIPKSFKINDTNYESIVFKAGNEFLINNEGAAYIYQATIGAFTMGNGSTINSTYDAANIEWPLKPRLYAACDNPYSYYNEEENGYDYASIGLYSNKQNDQYLQAMRLTSVGLTIRDEDSHVALESGELRFKNYENNNVFKDNYAYIKLEVNTETKTNILRLSSFSHKDMTDDIRFSIKNGGERSIRSLVTGEYRTDTEKSDETAIEKGTSDLSYYKLIVGWYDTEGQGLKKLEFEGDVKVCMAYGRIVNNDGNFSWSQAIPVTIDGKSVQFGPNPAAYADIYYIAFINTKGT